MKRAGLEDRIADAFATAEVASVDLEALLSEVTTAETQARDDYAVAKDVALDPVTRSAEVAKARKRMEDAEFLSTRLTTATQRLQELLTDVRSRERDAADRKERAAALKERDELAKDLSRFKSLTDEMVTLLTRLSKNNRRLCGSPTGSGLSADAIALGDQSIGTDEMRSIIIRTRLISFDGSGSWPPLDQYNMVKYP